ncbi:tRNA (adenosine(37)-N6)-threonylcarbamoyltransferase complex ATPase subunit type 1 TsaE [Candidatus Aerophobetes bacterium]|uniref:tRNA threonylcarbamoyladenosine biosynthesis protein TsaE n=1 Tax=Aerophobetes bacterium TaxID=2030807 RepID=A0A662D4T6_UNCAE|nr:MAG: tRNA (adenosine(37)-N6)-threonylcarbamoyltransferase complex ATPase subunit type 1 TsaE [Candidatus Aerophobetes bacterium]
MLSIITKSAEETFHLGKVLGQRLSPSCIVALSGELGSGKTVLVKGIGKGIGISSLIKSPSFVTVHEYSGPIPLYHLDLYRVKNKQEIISSGYEEYLYRGKGIVTVEWADKMEDLLPEHHLRVNLEIVDLRTRRISFQPYGLLYERIVEELNLATFRNR